MRVARICHDILIDVTGVFEALFNQRFGIYTFLQLYEWSNYPNHLSSRYSYQLVGWKANEAGMFTLNTDGCSKGNPRVSGGGGVLRDATWFIVFTFSVYFGDV